MPGVTGDLTMTEFRWVKSSQTFVIKYDMLNGFKNNGQNEYKYICGLILKSFHRRK